MGSYYPMYVPQQPAPPPAGPVPHRRAPRRARWSPWLVLGGVLTTGAVLMLALLGILVTALFFSQSSGIAAGVKVADVALGGRSAEAAAAELERQNFAAQPVLLTDESRSWNLTLSELGIGINVPATVQEAQDAAANTALAPVYSVNLNQTQSALMTLSEQVNIAPLPGNPPQIGRTLDIPMMLSRLAQNPAGELADGVIDLSVITIEPPAEAEPASAYTGATTTHVVEQGQELMLIAELYGVSMQDIMALNDIANPDLLYVGQELTIPAASVYQPSAAEVPAPPTTSGKAIVVSTEQQRIYAFENGQMIHTYLASTGLPATPTVTGDYAIYVKHEKTDMRGPDYYLQNVPYTMYFYQGYGIHGTYWHNSFGRPMSHGCVNLPTEEAAWFFNWADVGTPVRVV